jgi:hypothetical protein
MKNLLSFSVVVFATAILSSSAIAGVLCYPNSGGGPFCSPSISACYASSGHPVAGDPPCTVGK